ncbi:MAG TPA: DUF4082 domain-containing protein [Thermoanaerobaculia bacterium]|nr:DUF4082 domain-containing protein [Thermoanaerobaculia bacterium]
MRIPLRILSLALGLLTLGIAAAPRAAQAQNRDRWGVNDDSAISPSDPSQQQWGSTSYARAYEAGFGWSRYIFYWNNLNPSAGTYDFSSSDAETNAILNNGLQVFANIMWAPQWAVQNTPGYVPWNCMDPTTVTFVPTNPGCDNRRPDTAAFQTFVSQAVSHYGNRIRYWSFWNEPQYGVFWHAWPLGAGYDTETNAEHVPLELRVQELVNNVLIPGAEAARAANPNVVIVGPDADDLGTLMEALRLDAQYLQQHGRHLFDVISFHQYPPNGDATQLWGPLDTFNAPGGPLQTYRDGRPVWVTESNAHLATVDQLFSGFDQRPWIDRFFYYGFKSGHCLNTAEAPLCQNWWAQGSTGDALIDRMDVRLDPFYKVQSVIAPRIFTTQVPATFGAASPGYEVATQLSASVNGTVKSLRFYRPPGETGNNTLHLWTDTGTLLASATFVDNGTGASGWQEVPIGGGVTLTAGTRYRVSVNTNTVQSKTNCGIGSGITNGPLTAWQGFWGQPMGSMPVNASCSNFFVDVVFEPGTEIFTSQTPASFSSATPGYEVATQFSSSVNGTVKGLRFYRAPGETGDNVLRLWTDGGTLLATARFVDNGSGASGWQEVGFGGVAISAGTRYRVSVNTNTMQSKTNCGLGSGLTNGPLTAWQGFWGATIGSMPTNASCSNFFVDPLLSW